MTTSRGRSGTSRSLGRTFRGGRRCRETHRACPSSWAGTGTHRWPVRTGHVDGRGRSHDSRGPSTALDSGSCNGLRRIQVYIDRGRVSHTPHLSCRHQVPHRRLKNTPPPHPGLKGLGDKKVRAPLGLSPTPGVPLPSKSSLVLERGNVSQGGHCFQGLGGDTE